MSAFMRPNGLPISKQTLTVTSGSVVVSVWGLDFQRRELEVVTDAMGVTCEKQPVKIPLNPDNQDWLIKACVSTRARLEARTLDGGIWDTVDILFKGLPSAEMPGSFVSPDDKAAVFAAARSGRIRGAGTQLAEVEKNGFYSPDGKRKILLGEAMYPVLASLARGGNLNILSLMRFGQGMHGNLIAEDAAICTAMDIAGYAGSTIDLTTPQKATTDPVKVASTIAGVAAVVKNLPTGEYAFGFTRPTNQDNGPPQPENDVFLPKKPNEPNYKTELGNACRKFVNPDAVSEVGGAFAAKAGVRITRMFQDGRDHLHLEVISSHS